MDYYEEWIPEVLVPIGSLWSSSGEKLFPELRQIHASNVSIAILNEGLDRMGHSTEKYTVLQKKKKGFCPLSDSHRFG